LDHGACFIRVLALVFWAYSKRRKADFDELARLPLEDEPARQRLREQDPMTTVGACSSSS